MPPSTSSPSTAGSILFAGLCFLAQLGWSRTNLRDRNILLGGSLLLYAFAVGARGDSFWVQLCRFLGKVAVHLLAAVGWIGIVIAPERVFSGFSRLFEEVDLWLLEVGADC